MRHRNYSTTQRDINLSTQLQEAVGVLHVPAVRKKADG
jgi:hypothetical protein